MSDLLPARLTMETRYRGAVKHARVRVYADDEYRAQNLEWKRGFDERLEYTNAVLEPSFGVHLVAEYRDWNHHAPGASLADDLAQLQHLDAGDDVLSVIGLTSSLSLTSATFDQIGFASVPGRHMMLRGYADLEERKAFERAFPDVPADERANALEARRRHKTTALLLHELAHNLGLDHDATNTTLLSARYSTQAAGFSSTAHDRIQRAFDQRLGRASSDAGASVVAASAPSPARHPRLQIVLLANSVSVEGKPVDDGELNVLFSVQAGIDPETEVVIAKDKGVPSSRLIDLIDRAKAQGLKNIAVK